MEQIVIKNGSFESGEPILLVKNDRIWDDDKQPCPHCHSPIKIIHTRGDLSTWEETSWTNTWSALIPYDGTCCHTMVCVKCLLDGIAKNNIDTDSIKEQLIEDFENIPSFTEIRTELLKKEGWTPQERGGCNWEKGNDKLEYRDTEDSDGWRLNEKEVEFMEDLSQTNVNQ